MRSYAIVGTGAVGGYYGACLQKAGFPVHYLLRSDFEAVRRGGLRVDSPRGGFVLPEVAAYASPRDMPRCDVVVVAWKTTGNSRLADTLPHLVKPGGTVLVLQNGLDPEREAAPHAGGARVLAGLCFLASRKEGPGHIRHQDYGSVTLAAYGGGCGRDGDGPQAGPGEGSALGVTGEMRQVAADLGAAGIETRLHEDWRAARWRKLVWNVPFNGLCALLGADTRSLLAAPEMRELVREVMEEVIAGAAAAGCPLPAGFAGRMLADTDAMIPYEPSMKLDRDRGRPMELDAIYGRVATAIARAGGKAPLTRALWAQLVFLERDRIQAEAG